MVKLFHPLLALITSATDRELAKYVDYLKEENKILRARIPGQIHTRPVERERLLKFGKAVGRAIEELMTIVSPATPLLGKPRKDYAVLFAWHHLCPRLRLTPKSTSRHLSHRQRNWCRRSTRRDPNGSLTSSLGIGERDIRCTAGSKPFLGPQTCVVCSRLAPFIYTG